MEFKAYFDLQKNFSSLKVFVSSNLNELTEIILAPHAHLIISQQLHSSDRMKLSKLIYELSQSVKNFQHLIDALKKIESGIGINGDDP